MTSLDRFIEALMRLAQTRTFIGRYRLGAGLLYRKFTQIQRRIQSDHLPTHGFREDLVKHGQAGEMYRHLYFHMACYLMGPPGWLFSWFIGLTDIKQAASGRQESETEVRDNLAGRECGRLITAYMKRQIDEQTTRKKLRELLGKKEER